ncbi:MAG TPA: glycosyltransferase family 2 protein, partial [Polyangiaceae bacterium]|nr:glycosyltransferase family 2 protein [Polyangiaceae bacterium]
METSSAAPGTCALTVAVCTRNRRDDLRECVASVLANPGESFELLVVDQSDEADAALEERARADSRLRYHVASSRGLSRARNEVLELARGRVIAFTDDDCRVGAAWVADIEGYFSAHPEHAVVFGRVIAPAELHLKGYVATFEPAEETFVNRFPSPVGTWGIGACMALKRAAIAGLGGFDPALGAGAPIPAGEELDFTIRAIGAGLTMATTSAFEVTHLGVREHDAARKLFLGYVEGAGAAYVKNIRLATPGSKRLFAKWLAGVSQRVLLAAATGRRPVGAG